MKRVILVCATILGTVVLSQPALGDGEVKESRTRAITVTAETVSPSQLTVFIEPGPPADRAIRIYSEPSHTLLALVVDTEFKKSSDFEVWNDSIGRPASQATAITPLPWGQPRLTVPARPAGDTVINVFIHGTWPDGEIADRLVSSGKVGGGDFSFTTYVPSAEAPNSR